ncbi:MAG: hypothetical protein ACJ8GN_11790 [Longimicrobiaceae bacterium]
MNTTTADATASTFALPENVGLATMPPPPLEGRAMNPVPGWMDVLREQFSSVALAMKREAMVVAGFLGLFTAFVVLQPGGGGLTLTPSAGIAAALAAVLVPMVIWKGEDPARRGYHHAMPVDHGLHAIARGAAGLAWTMAGVTAFFAWIGLLTVITGGSVANVEPWQWLAPFAGAAVTYLLGSALTLVSSRPWKWLGLGAIGFFFVNAFRWSARPLADAVNSLLGGYYGLTTVLTGLVHHEVRTPHEPWMAPDAGAWLTATFLWMALALTLFLWASYRQPER